jgi:hypothetical protein
MDDVDTRERRITGLYTKAVEQLGQTRPQSGSAPVALENSVGHAACEYSLISPPRIFVRCTRTAAWSAADGHG